MERLTRRREPDQLSIATGRPRDPAAPASSVHPISHHRMPQVLQVYSDLVGTARMELEPDQIDYRESGHEYHVGSRDSAGSGDEHAFPVGWVPRDRSIHLGLVGRDVAPDQGSVGPLHPARGNSAAEPAMRQVGLGHDHEPRGIAVEPVHDTRPSLRAAGEGSATGHQCIHQRVIPVTWRRMHHEPRGLVDHREMLVLEHDGERKSPGLNGSWWFLPGKGDAESVAAGEHAGGSGGLPTDADQLVGDQPRGLGSRDAELIGKKPIETLGLLAQYCKGDFVLRRTCFPSSPLPRRPHIRLPKRIRAPDVGRPLARERSPMLWRRS